ncbi:MAG: hypothetical protein ACRYGR_08095 [Janthinobacterium lividum]
MINSTVVVISFIVLSTSMMATTTVPIPPTANQTKPVTKMELMVKAADLQRQALQKQITNPKLAADLRTQAKQLTDEANKMK